MSLFPGVSQESCCSSLWSPCPHPSCTAEGTELRKLEGVTEATSQGMMISAPRPHPTGPTLGCDKFDPKPGTEDMHKKTFAITITKKCFHASAPRTQGDTA